MSLMSRSLKSLNTQMIMPLCRGIPASSDMRCRGGRSPVRGAFNLHWKSGSLDPSWSCSTFNICRRNLYTSSQRRSIWYQQYSSIVTHGTNQATKRCTAQIQLCVGGVGGADPSVYLSTFPPEILPSWFISDDE